MKAVGEPWSGFTQGRLTGSLVGLATPVLASVEGIRLDMHAVGSHACSFPVAQFSQCIIFAYFVSE